MNVGYTNLNQLEKVVEDCSNALRLDPSYIKALNRRATAREQLGGTENLYLSLCGTHKSLSHLPPERKTLMASLSSSTDFTAAAIIDNFSSQATTDSVERVMKQLANEKASEIMKNREPKLPSGKETLISFFPPLLSHLFLFLTDTEFEMYTATFIEAYLQAFRPQPSPVLPSHPSQGDETYLLASQALSAKNFPHAFSLYSESISQGISSPQLKAQAYNMRATFKFIMSDAKGALEDLEEATRVDDKSSQSWVKKASVHMELGKPDEAMRDFEKALEVDPKNADVYAFLPLPISCERRTDRLFELRRTVTIIEDKFISSLENSRKPCQNTDNRPLWTLRSSSLKSNSPSRSTNRVKPRRPCTCSGN